MSERPIRRVAVLGGGITGLSAAFYLLKHSKERGERIEVTVLEGSDRLGGKINTLRRDGFVVERGPDSFLARKQPMIDLARELGIEGELTGTNPAAKKTYIVSDSVLRPMPEGMTLGVPSDEEKFMRTDLVSEEGKLRALEELNMAEGVHSEDETVGHFLERRMGREMVERIFEPLLAGIHAGDLYKLGLQATFPQFKDMVVRYGSLIKGTMELARAAKDKAEAKAADAQGALPASVFITFRGGLSTVIEALEARLHEEGCRIRLDAQVDEIRIVEAEQGSGSKAPYRLILADNSELEYDELILTLPAFASAELIAPHADVTALANIRHVSVANVVFGYDESKFGHALDGSGFLVPRGEYRQITASTWTSSKWLHTAPPGKRLIRCYVGRSGDEKGVELSDAVLTAAVQRDLFDLMGLSATPEFVEITRLRHSMPQYPVGHTEAIATFRANVARVMPGVEVTGAAFGGVGLPDCVAQAKQAAERLLALH